MFEPGETVALINIPIVDDTVVESDEIFTAVLSAEENAILNDNSVTITIIDLDSKCNIFMMFVIFQFFALIKCIAQISLM